MAVFDPTLAENYVQCFEHKFPTEESRHDAAMRLANDSMVEAELPSIEHRSWNVITSHWGDDPEGIRNVASYMFQLKADVSATVGDPVMVITRGSIDTIRSDEEYIDDDLVYTRGVVTEPELTLGFKGNLRDGKGSSWMGVRPPYLGFGVQLELEKTQTVTVGILGDVETEPVVELPRLVPVYLGSVSLAGADSYHALDGRIPTGRRVEQRHIIFGDQACNEAISSLNDKTHGQLLERAGV